MPPSAPTTRKPRQQPRPEQPNAETALATLRQREAHPIVSELTSRLPAIARVLPRTMDPDRFQSIVLRAVVDNPELLTCSPESIIAAVMQAAQEGLEPTGAIGGAWLVPFYDKGVRKAHLIRDYRGLSRMAIRSGAAKRIESHPVRTGDKFEYELGTQPRILHRPKVGNNAEAHSYYAVAWLPDGSQLVEVMTREQVDHIRSKSKAKDSGPWVTDFDQMARKTTIKRIVNYLPLSPQQRERLYAEDLAEFGDAMAPIVRVSPVAQHGDLRDRASQRAQLLAGATEQPEQESQEVGDGHAAEPPAGQPPAPVPPVETDPALDQAIVAPEPELTLEEATMAVFAAAGARGVTKGMSDEQAWTLIDEIAREAIPDTDPDDLAVADWLAIRDRINAGEWSPAVARPGAAS